MFSTPTSRISADSVVFNTKTKRRHLQQRHRHRAARRARRAQPQHVRHARARRVLLRRRRSRRSAPTSTASRRAASPPACSRRRAGRSSAAARRSTSTTTSMLQQRRRPGEGRAGVLPAVLYYPIQDDDRATGFLMPTYGSSLATGSSISNAFFWAINRSQDATFFHDWMFSRGNGLGTEYRYMLGPQAQGDFRYYWLDEKEADHQRRSRASRAQQQVDARRPEPEPAARPGGARARRLLHRRHGAADLQPQLLQRRQQHAARYQGGVSGAWRNLSANGTLQPQRDVHATSNYSTVSGQAPGFTAALSGVRLGPLPIFGTVNAEAASSVYINAVRRVEQDLSLVKTDLAPSIRAPLSTLPFLQVNATAAYRTTYYSESLGRRQEDADRSAGDAQLRRHARRRRRPGVLARLQAEQRDCRSHEARRRADLLGVSGAPRSTTRTGSRRRPATTSSSAARRK